MLKLSKDKINLAKVNIFKFILTGRVSKISTERPFGITVPTISELVVSKITISTCRIRENVNLLISLIIKILCYYF